MKPAIIRSVDAQGRIILPVEIRRTMGISDGDVLEIHPAENGIYLSKYKNNSFGDQRIKKYLHLLYSTTSCSIAVCNKKEILFSKGIFLREGTPISQALSELIKSGKEIHITESVPILESSFLLADTVFPLTSPLLSVEPTALVLLQCEKTPITDQERICSKLVVSFINTLE